LPLLKGSRVLFRRRSATTRLFRKTQSNS
jgi:hypothetical protein